MQLSCELAARPDSCESVIVGAGLTGLTAALHLARRGLEVHVLEAGRVGSGASGRSGGIVLEGSHRGPLPGTEGCVENLARLTQEQGIDCGLELCGCLELEHRREGKSADLGWRDGSQTLTVANRVSGGLVDPGALLAGLARAAEQAGARIHEGCRVLALEVGRRPRLRLGDGCLESDRTLLAMNAYSPTLVSLGEMFLPALSIAVRTQPLDPEQWHALGTAARQPFYTVDLPYLWGRPLDDRSEIFGSGLLFDREGQLERIDLANQVRPFEALEARVRGLHPLLQAIDFAQRWAGPIALLRQRPPLLTKHPESERVVLTGGYTGHGVALALRAGELAAAALASEAPLPSWGRLTH